MTIREAIDRVVSGNSLGMDEASAVMDEIVHGEATAAQISALAIGLRMKGETPSEIAGLASVMRREALHVEVDGEVVDTCGTGGDGLSTFNISTIAAFVACGAGARVAKHGNRAITSSCGSADLLEALGIEIDLTPEQVARCVEEVGIGFMFAPRFHPAMRHAAAPRKEIGVRTVFNVLGPLTNPAGAACQLLGVASPDLVEVMGEVLSILGCRRAMVVHGAGGMDELSVAGETRVFELSDGASRCYDVSPEALGLVRAPLSAVLGGTAEQNATIALSVLRGERGPRRDVVLLNASAALCVAGLARSLTDGVAMAEKSLDSGAAMARLQALREAASARTGRV